MLRSCTNKVFELEYINQISKVAKTSLLYKSDLSRDMKRLSLILR